MIIKSLVYRYTDIKATEGKMSSSWTADFIQNKGEGQIFLLHGGPGVGKTFVRLSTYIRVTISLTRHKQ